MNKENVQRPLVANVTSTGQTNISTSDTRTIGKEAFVQKMSVKQESDISSHPWRQYYLTYTVLLVVLAVQV